MLKQTSRKQQSQQTKQKLFAVAVEMIKRHGYDHVTVSQICQEAGIAKGSFYVHYASKEEIVRESYYSDLDAFLQTRWSAYLTAEPDDFPEKQILTFLDLELQFADLVGRELTCLAYSLNLSACVPGPASHCSKRPFSQILLELLRRHSTLITAPFSAEDSFQYLESLVRGIMATWCFTTSAASIQEFGFPFLAHAVHSLFQTNKSG